jgi:hypothetical protein
MTINGDLTLAGATDMEINGTTRGTDYDAFDITGTGHAITLGGVMNLYFPDTPDGADVGTYDLFSYGSNTVSSTDHFTAINIYFNNVEQAPALSRVGQAWTTSLNGLTYAFNEGTGDLTLAAIPEPGQYGAAIGFLLGGLAWMRRRRQAHAIATR